MARLRRDPLSAMVEATRPAPVRRTQFLRQGFVFVDDPDAVHHVLRANPGNFVKDTYGYRALRLALGNGLLTAEGEHWRKHRRAAQPAFRKRMLPSLADTMATLALEAVDDWEESGVLERDAHEDMMRLTLRIVSRALFSYDLQDHATDIGHALDVALHFINQRTLSPLELPIHWPLPSHRRFNRALAVAEQALSTVCERRSGDEHDLLSLLLEAHGASEDPTSLRDDIVTLIVAGHETTAAAVSWTLFLLDQNPGWKDRIWQELDALGAPPYSFEDLPRMEITERILEESMRLYPPAWILQRRALAADELSGVPVRPGDIILFPPWVLHRSDRHWHEPERFDPDRFLAEARSRRHELAYIPFSVGQRKCIGDAFAMMEGKLILATLMARLDFELVAPTEVIPDPTVTLRPKGGVRLRWRPRRKHTYGGS